MSAGTLFANEFVLVTAVLDSLAFFRNFIRVLLVAFLCIAAADFTLLSTSFFETWRLDEKALVDVLRYFDVVLQSVWHQVLEARALGRNLWRDHGRRRRRCLIVYFLLHHFHDILAGNTEVIRFRIAENAHRRVPSCYVLLVVYQTQDVPVIEGES